MRRSLALASYSYDYERQHACRPHVVVDGAHAREHQVIIVTSEETAVDEDVPVDVLSTQDVDDGDGDESQLIYTVHNEL